jgi:hypothetical protein
LLRQSQNKTEGLTLGCSFAPELIKKNKSLRLPALKFVVEDLGIKDIRLGIRWNKAQASKGKVDIRFYKKYIDYCLHKKVNLCLNIGPIKTFRWPEEHIPEDLIDDYIKSGTKSKITLETEISKHALDYLEKLLAELKNNYGKELAQILIQPENEAFFPFGFYKVYLGEDYLLEILHKIKSELPQNQILLSSAGRLNLKQTLNFWQKVVAEKLYTYEDLTLGFNYYYKTNQVTNIPFLTATDPIIFAPPWTMSIRKLRKLATEQGFKVEISEAQFESWAEQTDPGSKFSDFNYLLNRSANIFPETQEKRVVRLWGIEGFALKNLNKICTSEEAQICRKIKHLSHML